MWMLDCTQAWVLVPLVHFNTLAGVILLARPPVDRALDWEDFDLLRIAGRQVASYLAEARAQGALADARRFDEFHRSEERRVGKECGSTCRSRWSPDH